MLGEEIGEASGSVTGVSILSMDGDSCKTQFSFGGSGEVLGASITDKGTFVQKVRSDGTLVSEDSNVVMLTEDGELVSWTGFGAGRLTGRGAESSWGMVGAMRTSSERLAHLNSIVTVIEYEVGVGGNYRWKAWEWTGSDGPASSLREEAKQAWLHACPNCETGELRPNPFLVRCSRCGYAMSQGLFRTLRQVRSLADISESGGRSARVRRPPESPAA